MFLLSPAIFNCLLYVLKTVFICWVEIVMIHTFLGARLQVFLNLYFINNISGKYPKTLAFFIHLINFLSNKYTKTSNLLR